MSSKRQFALIGASPQHGRDETITGEWTFTDAIHIEHTSTAPDDHALEIDVDAAGFGDVKALDIVYTTGALADGQDEAVILVNIDEIAATGGDIHALEVLATEGSAAIFGMLVGAVINPIEQLSGVFSDADLVDVNGSEKTTELSSGGAGNEAIFTSDNDYVIVGEATKFSEIEFILATGSSGAGISPTFEFSDGVDSWVTFTPTDGTNALRNTGVIQWEPADIPTWAVGNASNEFLIRIKRTRNNLATTPIANLIKIAIVTIFSWDKSGDLVVNDIIAAKFGGIASANLLDKTAAETISGVYTHTDTVYHSAASPEIKLNETDAPTSEKFWRLTASGGTIFLQTQNDSEVFGAQYLTLSRNGTSPATLTVLAALVATSYGGITEANLLDKTADEAVTGEWTFASELLPSTQMKYKTASTARTETTTLVDDEDLAGFVLLPDSFYMVEGMIKCDAASTTPDIKWTFQFSNAPISGAYQFHTILTDGTVGTVDALNFTSTSFVALDSGDRFVTIHGYIDTHASSSATVDFQWAQNTSSTSNTRILIGSWLKFTRMGPS